MVQKEQEKGWDFGLDPLLLPSSSESLTAPHPSKGASLGEAPGFSDEDPWVCLKRINHNKVPLPTLILLHFTEVFARSQIVSILVLNAIEKQKSHT